MRFCLFPADLLYIVEHRRVCTDVAHEHPQVGIPLRKLDALFAQLSEDLLKPRELVLLHHERVRPDLNQTKQLELCLFPPESYFFALYLLHDFVLAAHSFERVQESVSECVGRDAGVEQLVGVLGAGVNQVDQLVEPLRVVNQQHLINLFGCFLATGPVFLNAVYQLHVH